MFLPLDHCFVGAVHAAWERVVVVLVVYLPHYFSPCEGGLHSRPDKVILPCALALC